MKVLESLCSSSAVCLASFLVAEADIKVSAPVGQLFVFELQRETFQNEFEPFLKHYGKTFELKTVHFFFLQHNPISMSP